MEFLYADTANQQQMDALCRLDDHVTAEMLMRKAGQREVLLACRNSKIAGWLRFGFFWDSIPFMNLLFVEEAVRRQGMGRALVAFWEQEMQKQGYKRVMTSSLADEQAQFFYRKLGYRDCGCLLLPDEALEILFVKDLT